MMLSKPLGGYLFIYLFNYLFIYLFIYLFTYLFTYNTPTGYTQLKERKTQLLYKTKLRTKNEY